MSRWLGGVICVVILQLETDHATVRCRFMKKYYGGWVGEKIVSKK